MDDDIVTMTRQQWRQIYDALGPAADDVLEDVFGDFESIPERF